MSESLSKVLMVVVTVILVGIAAVTLTGVLKSNSDKSSQMAEKANFNHPNIYIVSPPPGGKLEFHPINASNKITGYASNLIVYSDRPLGNNSIFLKVSNVPPDKIYIKLLSDNESFNDGKITYHYKYNITVVYDKETFERMYNDNNGENVFLSTGSKVMTSLTYGELAIGKAISQNVIGGYTTKFPVFIVHLGLDNNGNVVVKNVEMINNSADKPTSYVVYDPSVPDSEKVDLSNTTLVVGSNTYSETSSDGTTTTYEGNEPVSDPGNSTNVTITDSNGNPIYSGSNVPVTQSSGYDSDGDGVVDSPTTRVDDSPNVFYIDSGYVLHYTIMNGDTKYPANIQITDQPGDNNVTNDRWITIEIKDFAGSDKTSAEQNYNNNNPTTVLTVSELIGRLTTEQTQNATPITDNNSNIIGYNIDPQGYIKEAVDLSNWLNDDKYHIINVTIYINGYLWDINNNQPSDKVYQYVYTGTLELDNTQQSEGTSTYDSSTTSPSSNTNVNYLTIFVSNPTQTTFTLWNNTTSESDISSLFYLREGNNTRGTDNPVLEVSNGNYLAKDTNSNSADDMLYVNTKDDYQNIIHQSDITTTTLSSGETMALKVESELVPYGIYNIQVTGKDAFTLLNKYFLWDGVDILWLDFDQNVGNYYPDFNYSKEYNITYSGDTLFGTQVLTYVVFTNDTFDNPHYVTNVPINESQVGVDLNNDGDTNDVVYATVFDSTMYHSLMDNVNGQPVWKTKYVGIRFTYVEDGLGEAEIPFYIENVTKGQNKVTVNGKQEDVWFAKIWVREPVIRDSSTGDNNGGYVYWYGAPYDIDGTLNSGSQ